MKRLVRDDASLAFLNLFRGRGDAYGSWEGGCVHRPLTPDSFYRHLNGDELIGVYPHVYIRDGWKCVWGCTDIDVDDLDAAANIKMAFGMKNIPAWIERTRKGYHVWVFMATSQIATTRTMRRAFLAAHQAIDYVAKEVNPKQEDPGKGYGNYVRLPYPNGFNEPIPENRYMLDSNEQPLALGDWLEMVNDGGLAELANLESIAEMYNEPARQTIVIDEVTEDVTKLLPLLSRGSFMYWQDGPITGRDRSTTLVRLAHKLEQDGLGPSEAFVIVKSADLRWGKFHLREDGETQIMKIISHVYGEQK